MSNSRNTPKVVPAGVVVDHKESKARYAVSLHNFNPKIHTKVRDLLPGESVLSFRPKRLDDKKNVVQTTESTTDPATAPAEVRDTK